MPKLIGCRAPVGFVLMLRPLCWLFLTSVRRGRTRGFAQEAARHHAAAGQGAVLEPFAFDFELDEAVFVVEQVVRVQNDVFDFVDEGHFLRKEVLRLVEFGGVFDLLHDRLQGFDLLVQVLDVLLEHVVAVDRVDQSLLVAQQLLGKAAADLRVL